MNRPLPVRPSEPPRPREPSPPGTDVPSLRSTRAGRRYVVEGLCCATEVRQIEAKLGPHPRVTSLRLDPVQHTLDVVGDIDADSVKRAIAELGMSAHPMAGPSTAPAPRVRRGRVLLAGTAGALWLAAVAASRWTGSDVLAAALATASVVAGGWRVFPRGFTAVKNRALDMNFLMSSAALGALLIGEFGEAASVMFLFAVAQLLEDASMDRARNAIRSLMELAPARARVRRGGEEVLVSAGEVAVGETVVVRPGEKIPVDGVVAVGSSSVDQAAITGESLPLPKDPGEEVFAGTLNGEGRLEVRSTRSPHDTTLARIIHSVEEAQATRAPSQAFVDRFARVYTPVVVGAALVVASAPPLLAGAAWGVWVYRALALLVVACPCALVISTPVTVVSALTGAARQGILIKGGLPLETAGRARVLAFDKTGTLTEGRPEVVSVIPFDGVDAGRVLALAAAVQAGSEHPLAAAIAQRARRDGIIPPAAESMRARPGRGAEARVDGTRVLVGSARLMREEDVPLSGSAEVVSDLEAEGRTVVLVAVSDGRHGPAERPRAVGALAVSDRVRPGAAAAVKALREAGLRDLVLLTGDNPAAAQSVARAVGIRPERVHAGLLPEDKVTAVRDLGRAGGPVLMVGDGVNDAPALAAADVGVAMGVAGTDAALETADVALMADDLSKLPVMIGLARRAEGIIRANIAFALLVKAVFVVLAVTGVATLWMAVLADMGASLLVIANGTRALRAPPPAPMSFATAATNAQAPIAGL